jgi:hypothetical protein
VHIDHLVRLELAGEREQVRDVAALNNGDGGSDGLGGWVGGGWVGGIWARFASGEGERQKERQGDDRSGETIAEKKC